MSRDPIQRGAMILFGLAAIGVSGWVALEATAPHPIKKDADAAVLADAATADAGTPLTATTASAALTEDLDAGLALPSLSFGDASLLMSGPKRIKVGLIIVTFAGAEGASASARPKAAALAVAQRIAEDAKTDFKKAVRDGDPGSDADFGHLERGVLSSQPQAEAAVFGLEPGAVSDVVETSRGFWIVKRID